MLLASAGGFLDVQCRNRSSVEPEVGDITEIGICFRSNTTNGGLSDYDPKADLFGPFIKRLALRTVRLVRIWQQVGNCGHYV